MQKNLFKKLFSAMPGKMSADRTAENQTGVVLTKLWIMCKIQYRKLDNYVIVSEYTCNRFVICFKCENWRR